jgi:hypothetical protein
MNEHNLKQYVKEQFRNDDIQKDDMYYSSFEGTDFYENPVLYFEAKQTFLDYIQYMKDNVRFYRYCRLKRRTDDSNLEEILYEIECSDTNYKQSDLLDIDYIYNWFFKNRIEHYLSKQFDFFLKIVDELKNE